MTVYLLLPAVGQVPVVGDIMIVKYHVGRNVRQRTANLPEGLAELLNNVSFAVK